MCFCPRVSAVCAWMLGVLFLISGTATSQVEDSLNRIGISGLLSSSINSVNADPLLVASDSVSFFLLFHSRRVPYNTDNLFIQKFDRNGEKLLSMDALPVCFQPASQRNAIAISDGNGGIYIAWQERRGAGTRDKIYVQRINANLEVMWKAEGNSVSDEFYRQKQPAFIKLPHQEGVSTFWLEDRFRQGGTDIYGQKFSETGEKLWGNSGIVVSHSSNKKQNFSLIDGTAGYIFAVWQEQRGRKDWNLFAQKINERGELQWNDRGVLLTDDQKASCTAPQIVEDSMGGLICIYEQKGKKSEDANLYSFRMSRYGDVIHHEPICEAIDLQRNAQLLRRDSLVFCYWEDFRNGTCNIYGQCIDVLNGKGRWGIDGRSIVNREGDQALLQIVSGSKPFEHWLIWNKGGKTNQVPDIRVIGLDSSIMYQSLPYPISTETLYGNRFRLALLPNGESGYWLSWPNTRSSEASHIELQQVGDQFATVSSKPVRSIHNLLAPEKVTLQQFFMIPWGEQGWALSWTDDRFEKDASDVWLQVISNKNKLQYPEGGQLVCGSKSLQAAPTLFADPHNLYIGWMDRREHDDDLFAQRFNRSGKACWKVGGLSLCQLKGTQNNLRMTKGPQGGVSCFWTDARDFKTLGFDLYMQVLDSTGMSFYPKDGNSFAAYPEYQNNLSVVSDSQQNDMYLFWMDDRSGNYQIYGQRANVQARPIGPDSGIQVGSSKFQQRFPAAQWSDSLGACVAWTQEDMKTGNIQVKLQGLRPDLSWIWPAGAISFASLHKRQTEVKLLGYGEHLYPLWLETNLPEQKTASLHVTQIGQLGECGWSKHLVQLMERVQLSTGYQAVVTDSFLVVAALPVPEKLGDPMQLELLFIDRLTGAEIRRCTIEAEKGYKLGNFKLSAHPNAMIGIAWVELHPRNNDRLLFRRFP